MFTAEQRAWTGSAEICNKIKSKRRFQFAGRDIGETLFSGEVIDEEKLTFNGTAALPTKWPASEIKLYPIENINRTIIG